MRVRGGYAITLLLIASVFGSSGWAQLTMNRGQFFHQNSTDDMGNGIRDGSEDNDQFGHALASGDFNNDDFADLAIGARFEGLGNRNDRAFAGVVHIIFGSSTGLIIENNDRITQNSGGGETAEGGDSFGEALAVGDFNNDEFDDLVISAVNESIDNIVSAGIIIVLPGSDNGPTGLGGQLFHQNSSGILGEAEFNDAFGRELAVGNFDGDAFDDVVIGNPQDDEVAANAGTVNVIYGSANGLTNAGDQLFHQNSPDIDDAAEANDLFGGALAVGDFDNDSFDDLAIGVSGENLLGVDSAGAVHILYGSARPQRLNGARSLFLAQSLSEITESPKAGDEFGAALTTGDFNGDNFSDLAVGIPGESINNDEDAGKVSIFFGSADGLVISGHQLISQGDIGIIDSPEANDNFGSTLSSGDYNGDGFDDLAIGTPNEDIQGLQNAGAINILYGSDQGLSIQNNQFFSQSNFFVEQGGLEENDVFGNALASADFDNDGFDDLSIGSPGETINDNANNPSTRAGAINVLYGAPDPVILIDGFD